MIPTVGTGPRVELVEKPLLAEKVTVLGKLGKPLKQVSWKDSGRRPHGYAIRGLRQPEGESWTSQGAIPQWCLLPWSGGEALWGSCGVQQPEHSRTPALLALVHFHGNSSQPCAGWCAPSISMAPVTMAPACSEKHRLKTEHKEKGAIHFPAITSPTAVVLLKAHVDLFRS